MGGRTSLGLRAGLLVAVTVLAQPGAAIAASSPVTAPGAAAVASGSPAVARPAARAMPTGPAVEAATQVLVRWTATPPGSLAPQADHGARVGAALGARGRHGTYVRTTETGAEVYDLGGALGKDAAALLTELEALPGVASVEPDLWVTPAVLPNDTLAGDLWGLLGLADGSPFGIDAVGAWGTATGTGVTVAVIDTGIRPHADLAGQTVAGYDFVTSLATANDGNGRDADPSDPGDWCGPNPSDWHGTHVSGTVAALAGNSLGVFGGAPGAKIEPVRVLGKCGGSTSDVAAGIRWAAGGTVAGVPANVNPAKVINMSFGGTASTCPAEMSSAIDYARSQGVVVIAAAGNNGIDAGGFMPANCPGVIPVAAIDSTGHLASFSDYGHVAFAAPGVDITSTFDLGATVPTGDTYHAYDGTSMAAPHAAAAAALLLSAHPALTADAVRVLLQAGAIAVPADPSPTGCQARGCGSGALNLASTLALLAANPPVVGLVAGTPTFGVAGQSLVITATAVDLDGIAGGEASVNGGPWQAMTAADAAFGGIAEGLTLSVPNPAVGTYAVCVRATDADAPAHTSAGTTCASVTVNPAGGSYVPLTPNRLLDTRSGNGLTGPLQLDTARTFQVTNRNSGNAAINVPAGAIAVTGNVTVVGATSRGWVTLTPSAQDHPATSTINFPAGDTRANGVTVPLSGTGSLSIVYNGGSPGATTHAIFDVTGYVVPDGSGATYASVTPNRLLDSRSGNGFSGKLQVNVARSFQVTERTPGTAATNVPAGAIAVTGNVTVVNATSAGWLTLTPAQDNAPATSTLNFPAGDTRANGVTVPLSGAGALWVVYNGGAPGSTTDAIFDVTGYFMPGLGGAHYVAVTPSRLLDSRSSTGFAGPLGVAAAKTFTATGRAAGDPTRNVPASAIAVTGNLTVTGQTAAGWLTLEPTADNNPTTSTLNFPVGDDRANGATVPLSATGTLSVAYNGAPGGSTSQAIFDVTGYFLP